MTVNKPYVITGEGGEVQEADTWEQALVQVDAVAARQDEFQSVSLSIAPGYKGDLRITVPAGE
jgi:hypothetical protein